MKKTVAILLMTTLVFSLVACSVKDTSSKYSSADFSASNTSVLPAIKQEVESADSVNKEVSSLNSSKTESVNTSSTVSNESISVPSRITQNSHYVTEPPPDPREIRERNYNDENGSLNDFVLWLKSGGKTSVCINGKQTTKAYTYKENKNILKWAKTQTKILVPTVKGGTIKTTKVISDEKKTGYIFEISSPIYDNETISFNMFPIIRPFDEEAPLLHMIQRYADNKIVSLKKCQEISKFGEYYSRTDSEHQTAYFRYDDYVVKLVLPGFDEEEPFDIECFKDFELEYVSLEN